jgi:Family of unknown function (DUF6064)
MMDVPFTAAEFLEVFARYNRAVWPMQVLFHAAAAGALWLAARPRAWSGRATGAVLAFFWAWMGVVYHWGFFRAINPAASLFGALFVLQAVLLTAAAPRLSFRARRDAYGAAGVLLAAYALVAYPLLGLALGERYPAFPTFGLPCPTTIFTFALLLWAEPAVPARLLAIPAAWSVLGTFAALSLGIPQDFGLAAAGLIGTALALWKGRGTVRWDPAPASAG